MKKPNKNYEIEETPDIDKYLYELKDAFKYEDKWKVDLQLHTDSQKMKFYFRFFRAQNQDLYIPKFKVNRKAPKLQKLSLFADNLPISWGKVLKTAAAEYEERINELWGAGKYRSAKWNQKLAWICAFSNLGYYLWLKVWKPVSTVFRRLL
ncbi:MAG TPA: hypothetical protein PKC80_03005 [Burkholderiaceae bacterium]|nr:hypothetical protein [Burkholderiaceae bacterium]